MLAICAVAVSGCESWNWRGTGEAWLESLCDHLETCPEPEDGPPR